MVKALEDMVTMNSDQEEQKIWDILTDVFDPEIPVLSIIDLGIVRKINFVEKSGSWNIIITPTYSGCPAMDVINMNIRFKLLERGISNFTICTELSPAWTTAWMTEGGKQKLKAYGIAPPGNSRKDDTLFGPDHSIACPQCCSMNTVLISEFGSTACKALYQCEDCKEPFDHFKCH